MRARSAAPVSGITGRGYIDGGATIIPLRRRRRECTSCGQYLPTASPSHHTLCTVCYRWDRALVALSELMRALREVRR